MAVFNLRRREINAKIVYYGPGLSGKTTNLQFVHQRLKPEHRGELMSLATQTDRTLFFDFLPIELGDVRGLKTRFQLYTVPGQVFYNSTRRLVLKGVDGIVFVADSRAEALSDNLDSLRNLEENLKSHHLRLADMPLVLQYNKRDAPTAMSVEELNKHLNPRGVPVIEAQANRGVQVLETLSTICRLVIRTLKEKDAEQFRAAELSAQAPQSKSQDPGGTPPAGPGTWRLVTPEAPLEVVGDKLRVPVRLTNGSQQVEIVLSVSIESAANKP